jgi:hypothetical protein
MRSEDTPDYSDLAYALAGFRTEQDPYAARRKLGYSMLQAGMDASPIQSPWQGAARLAQALAGGWAVRQANEEQTLAYKKNFDTLARIMAEPDPEKRAVLFSTLEPGRSRTK